MNLKKWNRLLKTQDFPNATLNFWKPWSAWLNENIPDKTKRILVLGCSMIEKELMEKEGYSDIICIDYWAKKGIIEIDMHDLTFPKESFDYVLGKSVLEHSHCPFMLFLEVRSVLKTGGSFIFTSEWDEPMNFSSTHPFLTSRNDLIDYMTLFGFSTVKARDWTWGTLQNWRKEKEVPDGKYQFKQFVMDWESDFH